MYFCPKCNNSFDISKSTGEAISKKKLDDVEGAIKRVKANKDMNDYTAGFTKEELEENKYYKNLSDEQKDKLNLLFSTSNIMSGIEFKCNNCNFRKKIKETIRLYQMSVESTYSVNRSTEDNKLLAMNPIYPRTRDYTCKNINCITHKDINIKEAVFFREKDSYQTNYICTVCFSGWKVI